MSDLPPAIAAALAKCGQDFTGLMKEVAPEKAARVDEIIAKHNVSFEIDQEAARIRFYAVHKKDGTSRKIGVGARCLPRLWGTALAYHRLYNAAAEASASGSPGDVVDIDFEADPGLAQARGLLHWAILTEVKLKLNERAGTTLDGFEEFPPDGLPVPFAVCHPGSDEEVADQLSYVALAFILHHEFAHIYCEHLGLDKNWILDVKKQIERAKGRKKEQLEHELQHEYTRYVLVEKEADTEAARWLLDGAEGPDELRKRLLGVVIGLSWLAATDPYIGPTNSPAYPPGYDRLYQTIEKFVPEPDHDIWAVVAFILMLHLQNAGKWKKKEGGYDSFKDIADWATDILSKESRFAKA